MLSVLGSGEVTISLMEWWKLGRALYIQHLEEAGSKTNIATIGKRTAVIAPPLIPDLARPIMLASDPVRLHPTIRHTHNNHLVYTNSILRRHFILVQGCTTARSSHSKTLRKGRCPSSLFLRYNPPILRIDRLRKGPMSL
jgi:hypothetical protein